MIGDHIERVNEKFARVEQVKKFAILDHDLSQETGELNSHPEGQARGRRRQVRRRDREALRRGLC